MKIKRCDLYVPACERQPVWCLGAGFTPHLRMTGHKTNSADLGTARSSFLEREMIPGHVPRRFILHWML